MKKFILICLFVALLCLPLTYFVPEEYLSYLFAFAFIASFVGQFGAIFFMRKRASGPVESIQEKEENGDFHNDFSKVGSGPSDVEVKPIDQSGNVFENARQTLDQDLEKIKN